MQIDPTGPGRADVRGVSRRRIFRGHDGGVAFGSSKRGVQHAVLMGMVFYQGFYDPQAAAYGVAKAESLKSVRSRMSIAISGGTEQASENILVENCLLRFAGFLCTSPEAGRMKHCVLRRNVVLDKYTTVGHTVGLWGAYTSLLLEECVFDHNGWLVPGGEETKGLPRRANPLSHNTYCTGMHHTTFRNNVFTRGASMGPKPTANHGPASSRKVVVENNFYFDGEIGIRIGGNQAGPLRWHDCHVLDNVMIDLGRSRNTRRTLGWGVEVKDWDGGRIAGNLYLRQQDPAIADTYAVYIGSSAEIKSRPSWPDHVGPPGHIRNVLVEGNIMHGLLSSRGAIIVDNHNKLENIRLERNQVQMPGLETPIMSMAGAGVLAEVKFSGNLCFSGAPAAQWFKINGDALGFAEWQRKTGDTTGETRRVRYPDDTRSIQGYMKHLGLEPTYEAFLAEIRQQSRARRRPEFTAPVINDWMRAGFGLQPVERTEAP